MEKIPAAAWLIILVLVLMIVLLNLSLLTALKNRNKPDQTGDLRKFGERLRSPWGEEEHQLEILRKKADALRTRKEADSGKAGPGGSVE